MSDDFFGKLDAEIDKQQQASQERSSKQEQGTAFGIKALADVVPIAEEYAAKLRERGISATVEHHSRVLTFKLNYADGGHHNLRASVEHDRPGVQFYGDFTNDDGKRLTSTDGALLTANNWSEDAYKSRLERLINDYVFYAQRHGGTA